MLERFKENFEKPSKFSKKDFETAPQNFNYSKSSQEYAPIFVRYGIGIVFFLFGIDQIFNSANWFAWTPSFVPFGAETFWLVNGIFNLSIGVLLLVGFLTRIAALLATLHLVGVIFTLGYNDISIRDFGLLLGALAILLNGADKWSLDKKIFRK